MTLVRLTACSYMSRAAFTAEPLLGGRGIHVTGAAATVNLAPGGGANTNHKDAPLHGLTAHQLVSWAPNAGTVFLQRVAASMQATAFTVHTRSTDVASATPSVRCRAPGFDLLLAFVAII